MLLLKLFHVSKMGPKSCILLQTWQNKPVCIFYICKYRISILLALHAGFDSWSSTCPKFYNSQRRRCQNIYFVCDSGIVFSVCVSWQILTPGVAGECRIIRVRQLERCIIFPTINSTPLCRAKPGGN